MNHTVSPKRQENLGKEIRVQEKLTQHEISKLKIEISRLKSKFNKQSGEGIAVAGDSVTD